MEVSLLNTFTSWFDLLTPDIVNSLFELVGGYFTWKNAHTLYVEKELKGVYFPTWVFFTSWGLWNIFYYSVLSQPWSFYAGIFLFTGNAAWVALALHYRKKEALKKAYIG